VTGYWALQDFSLLHSIQTGSGAHQPPIQWVLGAISLGVKRQEREADHSPPSCAEVKRVEGLKMVKNNICKVSVLWVTEETKVILAVIINKDARIIYVVRNLLYY
jgi:hypothetical protein